jgi:hypothetical protein
MNTLDLYLLDPARIPGGQATSNHVVAIAQCGDHSSFAHIPIDNATIAPLLAFRKAVQDIVMTGADKPTKSELIAFGNRLYQYLFGGSLGALYHAAPTDPVSLHILSNSSHICEVPWEFLSMPNRIPAPHRNWRVVRVLDTCGIKAPAPKRINQEKLKVLLVDPTPKICAN